MLKIHLLHLFSTRTLRPPSREDTVKFTLTITDGFMCRPCFGLNVNASGFES